MCAVLAKPASISVIPLSSPNALPAQKKKKKMLKFRFKKQGLGHITVGFYESGLLHKNILSWPATVCNVYPSFNI